MWWENLTEFLSIYGSQYSLLAVKWICLLKDAGGKISLSKCTFSLTKHSQVKCMIHFVTLHRLYRSTFGIHWLPIRCSFNQMKLNKLFCMNISEMSNSQCTAYELKLKMLCANIEDSHVQMKKKNELQSSKWDDIFSAAYLVWNIFVLNGRPKKKSVSMNVHQAVTLKAQQARPQFFTSRAPHTVTAFFFWTSNNFLENQVGFEKIWEVVHGQRSLINMRHSCGLVHIIWSWP